HPNLYRLAKRRGRTRQKSRVQCGSTARCSMAPAATASQHPKLPKQAQAHPPPSRLWPLMFGAIGVFGDIGTSPIYAFKEAAVAATGEAQLMPSTVIGILSLIVWSLLLLVTLKYVFVLLRADNSGEGGTFALMSLAQSVVRRSYSRAILLL